MTVARKPWALAVIYTLASLGVEILLMVGFRLRVPEDNRLIAPVILTVPPLLAALLCGYRKSRELFLVVALLAVLTLAITWSANRLTGIQTGLLEPIVVRSLVGFLAAAITNRALRRSRAAVLSG